MSICVTLPVMGHRGHHGLISLLSTDGSQGTPWIDLTTVNYRHQMQQHKPHPYLKSFQSILFSPIHLTHAKSPNPHLNPSPYLSLTLTECRSRIIGRTGRSLARFAHILLDTVRVKVRVRGMVMIVIVVMRRIKVRASEFLLVDL